MFASEPIPNDALLFHRVYVDLMKGMDAVPATAIRNTGSANPPGMSADWSKYSSAEDTRNRGGKPPEKYRVVSFIVGKVREIEYQSVDHTPEDSNRSHSTIYGPKDKKNPEIRVKFARMANIAI